MKGRLPRIAPRFVTFALLAFVVTTTGCSEVRGRRKIQAGNKLYKDGLYKEAVAAFVEAEEFVPHMPVLWLNKGYTCRQMLIPGAKTPENLAAANCAITAFKKYQELAPQDARGESLYVQTLYDSDQFETLVKMYEDRFRQNPRDVDAVTGIVNVYAKWNKVEEALEWYGKAAEIKANDPEAQYAVGVFIWQQLSLKGGSADKASFDPRPDPNKPKEKKALPGFGFGDIVSQQRIDLADRGIQYLEKAIALRPRYPEAMTFIGLLYRQQSFAYFDQPDLWQQAVDKAVEWQHKSLEAQGKPAGNSPATAPAGAGKASEETTTATTEAAVPRAKGKKKSGKGSRRGKRGGRK